MSEKWEDGYGVERTHSGTAKAQLGVEKHFAMHLERAPESYAPAPLLRAGRVAQARSGRQR